ncbi:hypothetical protein AAY473_023343 [Plecturocebus cupreus]
MPSRFQAGGFRIKKAKQIRSGALKKVHTKDESSREIVTDLAGSGLGFLQHTRALTGVSATPAFLSPGAPLRELPDAASPAPPPGGAHFRLGLQGRGLGSPEKSSLFRPLLALGPDLSLALCAARLECRCSDTISAHCNLRLPDSNDSPASTS